MIFEYEINDTPYTLIFYQERVEGFEDTSILDPKYDPFEHNKTVRVDLVEYTGKRSYDRIGTVYYNKEKQALNWSLDGKKVRQIR